MGDNTQVRQLYRDALSGKLNRREVFQRGIALGLSANVIGMLALNAVKVPSAFAAEEGKPVSTFYKWELNLHPIIKTIGEEKESPLRRRRPPISDLTDSSRKPMSKRARGTSTVELRRFSKC